MTCNRCMVCFEKPCQAAHGSERCGAWVLSGGGFGGVDAWTAGERVAHRPLLQRSSSKPPAVISVNWLVAPGCGELSEAAERASASSAARRAGLRTLRACASKGSESPAAEIVLVKAPAPEKPEKLEARLEDREPPESGWGWPRVFLLLWCCALHASSSASASRPSFEPRGR